MKLKKTKKIFLIIVLTAFVILFFNNNGVFAAINSDYSSTDAVTDEALDDAFNDSSLLGLLARLIYVVGRFLEWILGTIFKMLTGSSDFPWADKIVFNAVPLLDVNFINPDGRSFVGGTAIQGVLKDLYSTVLALAVAFFGIVVLITAIKLVISTIASEKAKYKQAIVDWLIGFVMLFCIHYFISFMFYLNEQLVIVASKIVTSNLEGANVKVAKIQVDTTGKELIDNVRARGFTQLATTLENNPSLLATYMNLPSNDSSKGIHEFLMKNEQWWTLGADVAKNTDEQYRALEVIMNWALADNVTVQELQQIRSNLNVYKSVIYICPNSSTTGSAVVSCNEGAVGASPIASYSQAISENDLKEIFKTAFGSIANYGDLNEAGNSIIGKLDKNTGTIVKSDSGTKYYITQGAEKLGSSYSVSHAAEDRYYWSDVLNELIALKQSAGSGKLTGSGGGRLLSDLATYFRYNSYNKVLRATNTTGLKNGNGIQIQNMIMYAILVAQSLILFIAYVKRLFYVILLAMMAPIVVVFDFFQKFGK